MQLASAGACDVIRAGVGDRLEGGTWLGPGPARSHVAEWVIGREHAPGLCSCL